MISDYDKKLNYYFRNGDLKHTFDYAKKIFKEWENDSETNVLIKRVLNLKKPYASIIFNNYQYMIKFKNYLSKLNLYSNYVFNKYGIYVVNFTKNPNQLLKNLISKRELALFEKKEPNLKYILNNNLKYYVNNGCDISYGNTPLECALVYGYPLNEYLKLY